jgi:hypothetical protein
MRTSTTGADVTVPVRNAMSVIVKSCGAIPIHARTLVVVVNGAELLDPLLLFVPNGIPNGLGKWNSGRVTIVIQAPS